MYYSQPATYIEENASQTDWCAGSVKGRDKSGSFRQEVVAHITRRAGDGLRSVVTIFTTHMHRIFSRKGNTDGTYGGLNHLLYRPCE